MFPIVTDYSRACNERHNYFIRRQNAEISVSLNNAQTMDRIFWANVRTTVTEKTERFRFNDKKKQNKKFVRTNITPLFFQLICVVLCVSISLFLSLKHSLFLSLSPKYHRMIKWRRRYKLSLIKKIQTRTFFFSPSSSSLAFITARLGKILFCIRIVW